jgi:hypothetical protein
MWIKDKSQAWVNLDLVYSMDVAADVNNPGYYVVLGRDQAGTPITTLWWEDGVNMTQAQAEKFLSDLMDTIGSLPAWI